MFASSFHGLMISSRRRSNLVLANYLLEHGVRVYFYPGMTHVKALLVDGWACLGSANLNHLSLRVCQEHNVASSDPPLPRGCSVSYSRRISPAPTN